MAEAKLLRQHKGRLEARMQILEDHNRQLEAQLQRLRQLLDEVCTFFPHAVSHEFLILSFLAIIWWWQSIDSPNALRNSVPTEHRVSCKIATKWPL